MSASTKLWATASKEWVIPSKPKPGRKPKKDIPQEDAGDSDEAKGRRIQNRAAQRAFRERKQSQLAELQARILSYEQGEIERNVALQNIAKRLKEENDKLRQENTTLKEKVAKLEQEKQDAQQQLKDQSIEHNEKKRWRDESPVHQTRQTRKRSRTSATPPTTLDTSSHPSPASTLVATPESTGVMSPPQMTSSDPGLAPPMPEPTFTVTNVDMEPAGLDDMLGFSSNMKVANIDTSFPQFNCGFCTDTTPCVCRELAMNQLNESVNQELLGGYKEPTYLNPTPQPSSQGPPPHTSPSSSSILENLPAYQPPVPLRRKSSRQSAKPIFPVFPAESSTPARTSTPTCSGDPSNCAACNDDAFGKAFCSAIEETVNSRAICDNCPSRTLDGPLDFARTGNGCCGGLMGCSTCPTTSLASATTVIQYEQESPQEYIPTNDAWQRIKEHPNVQFADLSLLAEVVASRSKCTGPRIVITPPPDHPMNQAGGQYGGPRVKEEVPRLVPQEILLECGRRRVREVHSEAVREALRLLDAKFT